MKAIEAFPVSEEEAQDIDELKQKFPHVADLRTALEDYFHIYDDMAAMEPQKFDMYFADFIKDDKNNSRKVVNSSVVGEIHDKYVLGDISTSVALQSLQESGMSTDKADELIHTWGKETVQQGLSADEKALVTNSLDEIEKQQFKETLIRAGYTEDEAQQILEQADQVEQQQTSMSGEVPLTNSVTTYNILSEQDVKILNDDLDALKSAYKLSGIKSSVDSVVKKLEEYFGTVAEGNTVSAQGIITELDKKEIEELVGDARVQIGQYSVTVREPIESSRRNDSITSKRWNHSITSALNDSVDNFSVNYKDVWFNFTRTDNGWVVSDVDASSAADNNWGVSEGVVYSADELRDLFGYLPDIGSDKNLVIEEDNFELMFDSSDEPEFEEDSDFEYDNYRCSGVRYSDSENAWFEGEELTNEEMKNIVEEIENETGKFSEMFLNKNVSPEDIL